MNKKLWKPTKFSLCRLGRSWGRLLELQRFRCKLNRWQNSQMEPSYLPTCSMDSFVLYTKTHSSAKSPQILFIKLKNDCMCVVNTKTTVSIASRRQSRTFKRFNSSTEHWFTILLGCHPRYFLVWDQICAPTTKSRLPLGLRSDRPRNLWSTSGMSTRVPKLTFIPKLFSFFLVKLPRLCAAQFLGK